jgi:polyhydroxybutyrate depolymerase
LVFNFHMGFSNTDEQIDISEMYLVADTAKFLIVYPQGLPALFRPYAEYGTASGWNIPDLNVADQDDILFVREIIKDISDNPSYMINQRRIHATGISSGGAFSGFLAFNLSDIIASVASVASPITDTLINHICSPARNISLLHIQGTDDPTLPANGWPEFGIFPLMGVTDYWANVNGCNDLPDSTQLADIDQNDNSTVTLFDYNGCDLETEVKLYRINGGGHTWPGGWSPNSALGSINKDINASSEIWSFFKRNPHPTYEPAWKQMESMNVARGGCYSCVIDSLIYVFGGANSSGSILNSSILYNTNSDVWSSISTAPGDFVEPGGGIINNKVYIAGGYTSGMPIVSASTYVYNLELDSWDSKNSCPRNIAAPASCVLEDKLYLFGGLKDWPEYDTSGQKDALVYDPASDTWNTVQQMLHKRAFGAKACEFNGQIYVFGGLTFNKLYDGTPASTNMVAKVERFDPVENNWTELADMPVSVTFPVIQVHNDKIYIFGGDSYFSRQSTVCSNYIQEYNPATDHWQIMASMPFKRSDMAGANVGDFLYIIGGYPLNAQDYGSVLNEVWRFNLDSLEEGCKEVKILEPSGDLISGDSIEMIAEVLPEDFGNMTIIWTSDNEGVVKVTEDGYAKGISEGSANITAQLKYGGCSGSHVMEVIPLGITKTEEERLTVYPNPTFDFVTIETAVPRQYNITIASLSGQKISETELKGTTHQLDLSSYQKGVYFITIRSKDFVTTRKIVKL